MEKNVLVVDDEKGFRDMYVYLLEPLGIHVTCACDGEEGVAKVRERAYDLVLMDIHMPKLTGPQAIKEIKAIRPDQKVVVFSSSSDPSQEFESQATNRGAIDCLYKPVDILELNRVLSKVFGSGLIF